MAKVKLTQMLEAIHGHIGSTLYRKLPKCEVAGKMPDFSAVEPTANQTAQREKFRSATLYGKACYADPTTLALYTARAKASFVPAFAIMVADFLNAPSVEEIDLSGYTGKTGEHVDIRASDDFKVESVSVTIRSQDGDVLEQGAAVLGAVPGKWRYTTTTNLQAGQAVSMEVKVTDLPGHSTTRTQPWS